MTLSTTASGNFDNKKSWSGLRKHMEHDKRLNHKNKYLNSKDSQDLRKYNSHEVLIDYSDWTEKHFGSFVKEHDDHAQKTKKFGSVKRFLQVDNQMIARKLYPDQEYMEKLSNENDWHNFRDDLIKRLQRYTWANGSKKDQKLTKSEAKDMAYKTMAKGFKAYARGFNERNPNVKMFEYYVHMDEEGAPHLHAHVMPFYQDPTLTKKGRHKKPSWSLNTALARQYGTKRSKGQNKKNLARFRKQEDQSLIDCMNDTLENELHISNAFKLIRKTDKDQSLETGVDHEVYKAKAKKLAELEQKQKENQNIIDLQNRTIKENNQKIVRKSKELESVKKELEKQKEAQEKHETELIERENKLNERAKILDERESKLQKLENKFKKVAKSVSKFFVHYYKVSYTDYYGPTSEPELTKQSKLYANSPYLAENVKDSFSEHGFKEALPDLKDVSTSLAALHIAFKEHNKEINREINKNHNKNINKESIVNNINDHVKSEGGARTDNVHDTRERVKIHYHDAPESPDDDIFDTF